MRKVTYSNWYLFKDFQVKLGQFNWDHYNKKTFKVKNKEIKIKNCFKLPVLGTHQMVKQISIVNNEGTLTIASKFVAILFSELILNRSLGKGDMVSAT